jgi:hypothetical protein
VGVESTHEPKVFSILVRLGTPRQIDQFFDSEPPLKSGPENFDVALPQRVRGGCFSSVFPHGSILH